MASFSNEVIELAQLNEARYGVPASVTLAQYALESGWGKSDQATQGNNFFNIGGSYNGQSITLSGRNWRKYDTMADSFEDHGRLLASEKYASLTTGAKNVYEYIDAIAETYAPSSDGNEGYADKLKNIIASNNLTQYDGDGGSSLITLEPISLKSMGESVLSSTIKLIVMVCLALLAFVFFMSAFDLKMPTMKNAVKEAVEE